MGMRPGVRGRQKPSSEAEQSYAADAALAGRRAELLDTASEAESQFRQAQARRAPDAELRRLALDLDSALTAEAERLLTLRETHRLNDIPAVTYEPSPPTAPIAKA